MAVFPGNILQNRGIWPFLHTLLPLWLWKPYEEAELHFIEGAIITPNSFIISRTEGHRGLFFSCPSYTDFLEGQRVEELGSPLDPREARRTLREQHIISNSNMAREGHDGTDATSPPQPTPNWMQWVLPPLCCVTAVQILGRTPRPTMRRERERGQEWGLIFACPSIVRGGKKWQHRVQFFSPKSSLDPAREARLTDDSQHLCYAAVTDEGLHIAISLFLSVYGTLPLSTHYLYFWHNRKNDRPSVEITLKSPITIILLKVWIFLPLSP